MMRYFTGLILALLVSFSSIKAQSDHPYYHSVYRASATDGFNFSEEITPIAQHISAISMLRMPNGTTLMYGMRYASVNDNGTLFVATSTDGRNFSAFQPITIPNTPAKMIGEPCPVIHTDGRIRLYYIDTEFGTLYEMYSAISTDGINFTHENGVRLLRNNQPLTQPDIIRIGNLWNAYFTVPGTDNLPRLVRATSNDGISFSWDNSFFSVLGGQSSTIRANNLQFRTYYVKDKEILSTNTADGRGLNAESGKRLQKAMHPSALQNGNVTTMYFIRPESPDAPPLGEREEWRFNRFVIGKNANVDPTITNPATPDVIRMDDGTYRMFYSAGRPGQSQIRVAISGDGITWQYASISLRGSANPSDRTYNITSPSVIQLPDGRWRMYYNAYPEVRPNQRAQSHIRSALSNDGINFVPESNARMEIYPNDIQGNFAYIGSMTVYALPNGTYGALVNANPTGDNTTPDLYFASSIDGLVWGNYKKLYTDLLSPEVVRRGNTFILYANYLSDFTTRLESTDGTTWTGTPAPMMIRNADNSPATIVEEPCVVFNRDNRPMMYGTVKGGTADHIAYYEQIVQPNGNNNSGNNNPNCTLTATVATRLASSTLTNDGQITVTTTNGTAPYTYLMDNRQPQNSNTFTNLEPRTYSILVKDANQCQVRVNVQVNAFNTGGNTNTERWFAKKYAIGVKAGTESSGLGSLIMPNVIRLANNTYRMYFNGGSPGNSQIRWSVSTDGLRWSNSGIALQGNSSPSDREYIIGGASVIQLADGRFRMYYRATGQFGQGQMPQYHIRSAISSDGQTFTREQGIRVDITPFASNSMFKLVGHSSFYYLPESQTYAAVMSVNTNNDNGASDLYVGFSPDGLTWSNFRLLFVDAHDPVVVRKDGQFILYAMYLKNYTFKATSADGITWSSNKEIVYGYDLEGKDLPLIADVGAVVTRNNQLLLYSNYFSGLEPFEDHIVVYEQQTNEQVCTRQPVNLSLSASSASCLPCRNGIIRATATNGQTPYQYAIEGQPTQVSNGVFGNLLPGEYTVNVKDGRGCTATAKIKVEAVSQPTNPTCLRPADVYIENIASTSAQIYWVQVTGATAYSVGYRKKDINANYNYFNVPANQTNTYINGLEPNTSYEIVVQTVCANNVKSEGTPVKTFTTLPGQANSCAPTLNVFLAPTVNTMTVTWNIMPSAQSYLVTIGEDGSSQVQELTVQAPRNYVRITGLKANTLYRASVRVRCLDQAVSTERFASAKTLAGRMEAELTNESPFLIYPNPAQDYCYISATEPTSIALINVAGQSVAHFEVSGLEENQAIDISNLPGGIYLLRMTTMTGAVYNHKLIIRRD